MELYKIIQIYLVILIGFFVYMWVDKKRWFDNKFIYFGSSVFVPTILFILLYFFFELKK